MISDKLRAFNGIQLPIPEQKILERQYLETLISEDTINTFAFKDIVPSNGRVTWIIGTAQNRIPEATIQAATYALVARKPKELQSIDNNNNHAGRSTYRFDKIVEKYEVGSDLHKQAAAAKLVLDDNLNAWRKVYSLWGKHCSRVSYYKAPNPKIRQQNLLLVSLNPRKGVLNQLNGKLDSTSAAIIGDMDCASLFDLGSRDHFMMNDEDHSINALRAMAQKTQHIVEQRCVYIESSQKKINLVRHVHVPEKLSALSYDESISLKNFYTECAKLMPAWQDVANNAALSLNLSAVETEKLLEKAANLDRNSNKYKQQFGVDDGDTHGAVSRNEYIRLVLDRFAVNQDEVLDAYESVFGQKIEKESYEDFVRRSAQRDYAENSKNYDFVFPEIGVVNVNDRKSASSAMSV